MGVAILLHCVGDLAYTQGNYKRAKASYTESFEFWQEIGHPSNRAWSLTNLGYVAFHQAHRKEANTLVMKSLVLHQELDNKRGIAACLIGLACIAEDQGKLKQIARLLGSIERLLEVKAIPLIRDIVYEKPLFRTEYERLVAAARSALGAEAFEAALATGRALTLEQAIALALEDQSNDSREKGG